MPTDDSLAFCKQLLEDTGVDRDTVDGRHFIRLSFAVSSPEIEEALTRLKPWFAARTVMAGA